MMLLLVIIVAVLGNLFLEKLGVSDLTRWIIMLIFTFYMVNHIYM